MSNQTKLITDIEVDDPVVLDASYDRKGFTKDDRRYIDNQALGAQTMLKAAILDGTISSWHVVDQGPASVDLHQGDCVCIVPRTDGELTITLATADALAAAGACFGVVMNDAARGTKVRTATGGLVAASITDLGDGSASPVRVGTDGRCERVVSLGGSDFAVGVADSLGNVMMIRGGVSSNSGAIVHGAANQILGTDSTGAAVEWATVSGDASVTISANTATFSVNKLNGTTITTAGGSLTLGQPLRVTGASSADWGPLDLANANAVTGVLPISHGGTGQSSFATGVIHSNGSALSSSLIVNADVDGAAAIAGSKITPSFGSQALTAGDATLSGNLTVGGDLVVNGTTTTINSTVVDVADRVIHVNHSTGVVPVPVQIAGIEVDRGSADGTTPRDGAGVFWAEADSAFRFALNTAADDATLGNDVAIRALGATLSGLSTGVVHASASGVLSSTTVALSEISTAGASDGDVISLSGGAWTHVALTAASVGAVPTTRTLTGTAPITIDGDNAAHDLSANRTIAVAGATTGAVGVIQLAQDLGGAATAPAVIGLTGTAGVVAATATVIDFATSARYDVATANAHEWSINDSVVANLSATGLRVGDGTAASMPLEVVGTSQQIGARAYSGSTIVAAAGMFAQSNLQMLMLGAESDGSTHIARNSLASLIYLQSGLLRISVNSGLTPGNPLSPTTVFGLSATGLRVGDDHTPTERLEIVGNIAIDSAVSSPKIYQLSRTSGAGQTLRIASQSTSDAGQPAGGDIELSTGYSTGEGGAPFGSLRILIGSGHDDAVTGFLAAEFGPSGDSTFQSVNSPFFDATDGANTAFHAEVAPTPKIAFFGASPQAKPTISGSRGSNAALTSLLTALANMGLVTNSTT